MKLYERDYCAITPEEQAEWEAEKAKEVVYIDGKETGFRRCRFHLYPKAVRHFTSLFPNNYLDTYELKETERLNGIVSRFEQRWIQPPSAIR